MSHDLNVIGLNLHSVSLVLVKTIFGGSMNYLWNNQLCQREQSTKICTTEGIWLKLESEVVTFFRSVPSDKKI